MAHEGGVGALVEGGDEEVCRAVLHGRVAEVAAWLDSKEWISVRVAMTWEWGYVRK